MILEKNRSIEVIVKQPGVWYSRRNLVGIVSAWCKEVLLLSGSPQILQKPHTSAHPYGLLQRTPLLSHILSLREQSNNASLQSEHTWSSSSHQGEQ